MSVRPKSILKRSTYVFPEDMEDINPDNLIKSKTKVRVLTPPEHVHFFIADSFGRRIIQFFDTRPFDVKKDPRDTSLLISPHKDENHLYITVRNYCEGGRRLADGIKDHELADIVEFQPKSILIMLGMVDIASQIAGDIQIHKYRWFKDTMISVVESAKDSLRALVGDDEEALLYVNRLMFHFAHLPPWGTEYTPRLGCISPSEVKTYRKKNQKFATRFLGELVEHNIMLVDLNVNEPSREGDKLHYDEITSEKLFRRVKTFFFRFNCSKCGFFHKYKSSDYSRESRNLIFAPSCEFDILSLEGLGGQQAD